MLGARISMSRPAIESRASGLTPQVPCNLLIRALVFLKSLARALIRRPKLLILDEATSALDSHSELLIKESIENLAGETTIICIAHRLSTIQSADRIYYLEAGKIIEEGTFKELINRKESSFRKTAELQGII